MRLTLEEWKNIFRNLQEEGENVEIIWLDAVPHDAYGNPTGEVFEWVLCHGCEIFEDGFEAEKEAQERLDYLENIFL